MPRGWHPAWLVQGAPPPGANRAQDLEQVVPADAGIVIMKTGVCPVAPSALSPVADLCFPLDFGTFPSHLPTVPSRETADYNCLAIRPCKTEFPRKALKIFQYLFSEIQCDWKFHEAEAWVGPVFTFALNHLQPSLRFPP